MILRSFALAVYFDISFKTNKTYDVPFIEYDKISSKGITCDKGGVRKAGRSGNKGQFGSVDSSGIPKGEMGDPDSHFLKHMILKTCPKTL